MKIGKTNQRYYKRIYKKNDQRFKRQNIQILHLYKTLQHDVRSYTKPRTQKDFKYNV